jgi:SAM-dependent methyltransferase
MDAHVRLFDSIAPAYRLFYGAQRRRFREILALHLDKLGAAPGDSFLDIGCGTGALVAELSAAGFRAEGVDAAPGMVAAARRSGADCRLGDVAAGLAYPNAAFDYVISSFVAHGLEPAPRARLYAEARRLARKAVVIHDYYGPQPWHSKLIERIEGGGFFGFIAAGEAELAAAFDSLEILAILPGSAWYVGRTARAAEEPS